MSASYMSNYSGLEQIDTRTLPEEEEPDLLRQLNQLESMLDSPAFDVFPMHSSSSPRLNIASENQKPISPTQKGTPNTAKASERDSPQRFDDLDNELTAHRQLLSPPRLSKLATLTSLPDTHAPKKRLRDSLRRELEQLGADVTLAKAENKRLLHLSITDLPVEQAVEPEIHSMLLRATAGNKKQETEKLEKNIFKNLGCFLPFSSRRRNLVTSQTDSAFLEQRIPSNAPQAIENPLPFLQAFTPLIWTSKVVILPSNTSAALTNSAEGENDPEVLKQLITASHPQGFFSARLALTVDTKSRRVHYISLLKLPTCAEYELGTFIRNKRSGSRPPDEGNTDREIGVVCHAMSRWLEVSLHRARFWWLVIKRYSTIEARRDTLKLRHKHGRKRKQTVDVENEAAEDLDSAQLTLKNLLPHLGRSILCINSTTSSSSINPVSDDPHGIEVLFEWQLSFDWTGEVFSHLTARVRVPKLWQDLDAYRAFNRIPDIFRRLVRDKGALAAVAAVVSLTLDDLES